MLVEVVSWFGSAGGCFVGEKLLCLSWLGGLVMRWIEIKRMVLQYICLSLRTLLIMSTLLIKTRCLARHASATSLMLEYVILMQTNGAQGNGLGSMRLGQWRKGPLGKVRDTQ